MAYSSQPLRPSVWPTSALTVASVPYTGNGGSIGLACGRQFPIQPTAVSHDPDSTLMCQVEKDVFSVDDCGIAFTPGQLWVRTRFANYTATPSGEDDTNEFWTAVPGTLPSGYTARNQRNIRPFCGLHIGPAIGGLSAEAVFAGDIDVGVSFGTSYGSILLVRTPSGIYLPKGTPYARTSGGIPISDGTHDWGPHNVGGQVMTIFSTRSIEASNPHPVFYGQWSPGWRGGRLTFQWTDAFYLRVTGGSSPGATHNIVLFGVTYSAVKADLTWNATTSRWEKVITLPQMPAVYPTEGSLVQYTWDDYCNNIDPADGGGAGSKVDFSPRVDIPLPWTSSSGNLVAPGGILTGTVPGY